MCALNQFQPTLPLDVDPKEPQYIKEECHYIIPEGVRPVLRQYRIEVQSHNLESKSQLY